MLKRIMFTTIAVIALVAFAGKAEAKGVARKPVEQRPPSYDKVVSVNTTESTMAITEEDGKNPRTITVSGFTRITVSGKPGKLEDIKSGMKVDMLCSGGNVANRIDAMDPPVAKTPAAAVKAPVAKKK